MESSPKTSWRPLRIIVIVVLFGLLQQVKGGILVYAEVVLFLWLAAEIALWLTGRKKGEEEV